MKINLYTAFAAEHLENTASSCASEDLTCYGKSSTCRAEVLKWIHDDILDEIEEAWEDNPNKTDIDVVEEANRVFESGKEIQWTWECCDKQYIWKLVEQEIDLACIKDYNKDS